jgi:alkaline phosphatase D
MRHFLPKFTAACRGVSFPAGMGSTRVAVLIVLLFLYAAPETRAQQTPLARIAFGSCAYQERPQPIWRAVLDYRPQLFLFAGDNVYGDVRDGKPVPEAQVMESLRHAYAETAKHPEFMELKRTIPHLVTWDDHDFGKDDAGSDFFAKQKSQKLFLKFWNIPASDPRHSRAGVYHAQIYGQVGHRVQVIMLDTRYFRSPLKPTDQRGAPGIERYLPDDDPSKTMLGGEQWKWLSDRLREPADLRLIVSSIQVLADGHGWERWGNFPRERQRLFDVIRDVGASGVVFLSGDRHVGALYRETNGVPYPMIEITSSGINQSFPANREAGPNRLGTVYGADNFGTVDVDWSVGSLTLSIRGMQGESVRHHTISLNELRAR